MQRMLEGRKVGDDIPLRCRRAGLQRGLSRSGGGEDKRAAICLARKPTRLTGREIGEARGVKLARVSDVVTELEDEGRQGLWRCIERLRRRLDQNYWMWH